MARSFKLVGDEEARELSTHGFSPVTANESGGQEETNTEGEEKRHRRLNKRQRRLRRMRRERRDMAQYFAHAAADFGDDSIPTDTD